MSKKMMKDSIIVGFATFAIFFGAGNLIFPPFIGFTSGTAWLPAMIGMALTGIILPVLGVLAVSFGGGTIAELTKPIAPWFYKVFCILVMVVIGTMINVPRTAAVSYEIGILPNIPSFPKLLFSIIFFAIVFLVSARKTGVIDRIGKFISPFKIAFLLFIVAMVFIKPIGTPVQTAIEKPFMSAFTQSYFTADVLTGLLCANIILASIRSKGYSDSESKKVTINAIVIAGIGLFVIYAGLLILGANGSSIITDPNIERTALLNQLITHLLGKAGVVILGCTVTIACLTTAIGLTSATSDFLEDLTKSKVKYNIWVAIGCVVGVFFSNVTVDTIIATATPIFLAIYPMSILLVVLGLFKRFVPNRGAFLGAIICTFVLSMVDSFNSMGISSKGLNDLVNTIPLSSLGFTWLVPAIIGFIIGAILYKAMVKKGAGEGKTIALRADIDALNMPEECELEYKSK